MRRTFRELLADFSVASISKREQELDEFLSTVKRGCTVVDGYGDSVLVNTWGRVGFTDSLDNKHKWRINPYDPIAWIVREPS